VVASLAPGVVGNRSRVLLGDWTGLDGIRAKANEMGIDLPSEIADIVEAKCCEEMRWRKRGLTDEEFRDLVVRYMQKGKKT